MGLYQGKPQKQNLMKTGRSHTNFMRKLRRIMDRQRKVSKKELKEGSSPQNPCRLLPQLKI